MLKCAKTQYVFFTLIFCRTNGIKYHLMLQPAGTTVIVKENVLHQVVSLGYNFAEVASVTTHEGMFLHERSYTLSCTCSNTVNSAPAHLPSISREYAVLPRHNNISCDECKVVLPSTSSLYSHYLRMHPRSDRVRVLCLLDSSTVFRTPTAAAKISRVYSAKIDRIQHMLQEHHRHPSVHATSPSHFTFADGSAGAPGLSQALPGAAADHADSTNIDA